MRRHSTWGLDEKLRFLYQLWTGQSLSFQYDFLSELKTAVDWDQAVLLAPEPWITPRNEVIPFPVPDRACPAGLWSCDRSALCSAIQPPENRLDPLWGDWGHQIAQHYHLQTWILMIIDISLPSNSVDPADLEDLPTHQMPILLLRKEGDFNDLEVMILCLIYDSLRQIIFYFLIFENLLRHNNDCSLLSNVMNSHLGYSHLEYSQNTVLLSSPGLVSIPALDQTLSPGRQGNLEVNADDQRIGQSEQSIPSPIEQRYEHCIEESLKALGLTPRQSQVMYLIIKGKELTSIAQELGCREATVRKHIENLYRRLGVQTRAAAIAQVLERIGIV